MSILIINVGHGITAPSTLPSKGTVQISSYCYLPLKCGESTGCVCRRKCLLKHIVLIYGSSLDGDVINTIKLISEPTAYDNLHVCSVKGRTIWYLGGGGARVFVACKLFFLPPVDNKLFFWRSTSDNFFLCFVEEIFCHMLSLICTLPFGVFSGQHIFYQFRQQTFFSAHIFNKLFFLTLWRQTIFFNFNLSPPPPPDIKWCVCNAVGFSW